MKGRKTGGRKPGSTNKATADVKAAAQRYGREAIDMLYDVMLNSKFDAARVNAARELLDRGFGKCAQPITGEGGKGPVIVNVVRFTAQPLARH